MKNLVWLLIMSVFILGACGEEKKPAKPKKENLVEIKDGVYTEYYKGRKAIKFQGPLNDKKERDGRWFFYDEKGNEMSMSEYVGGKMHGMIFARNPNGNMRYVGEYTMGKESGLWRFYDVNGKLQTEKDYGKVTE